MKEERWRVGKPRRVSRRSADYLWGVRGGGNEEKREARGEADDQGKRRGRRKSVWLKATRMMRQTVIGEDQKTAACCCPSVCKEPE